MMAIADVQEERIRFAYGFLELSQKDNTDMEEANVGVPLTEARFFIIRHQRRESIWRKFCRSADCL